MDPAPTNPQSGNAFSLAAVHRGDRVRVQRILFDRLRSDCDTLGVREGEVLECRRSAGGFLQLENEGQRTILMQRDWARFIEVDHDRR